MQALTSVSMITTTDENPRSCWRTPDSVFILLDREFSFNLDGAAHAHNAKCSRWLGRDGKPHRGCLGDAFDYRPSTEPQDVIFVNPPYSGAKHGEAPLLDWCRLFVKWRIQGAVVVALLPASTSERWFEFAAKHADQVRLSTPRVKFIPPPGVVSSSNAGGNAVFVFDGVARSQRIVVWNWRAAWNGGAQ
jgi:phage N-6-adenine-methyltransferase